MYVNSPRSTNFSNLGDLGDFGWWQFVVGAVQGITLGSAAAKKYSATRKYLKTQKHTQQLTHSEQLLLKGKELSAKEKLLAFKGKAELYEDQQLKKLVIISFVTVILVTVVSLGLYYYFSVGGN